MSNTKIATSRKRCASAAVLAMLSICLVACEVERFETPSTILPQNEDVNATPTRTMVGSVRSTPMSTPIEPQLLGPITEVQLSCGPHFEDSRVPFETHFLQWSQDGTQLLFDFDEAVWTFDLENWSLHNIAHVNPGNVSALDSSFGGSAFRNPQKPLYGFYANLSRHDNLVAYSTCQYVSEGVTGAANEGSPYTGYEIAVVNLDGTELSRVTSNYDLDHYPIWSPHGSRLAFVQSSPVAWGIYNELDARLSITTVGSYEIMHLTPSWMQVALYPPVWSPDGAFLAFLAYEGQQRTLYTMKSDGTELSEIGASTITPSWSPSSERIAFANSEAGRAGIYTARPDGADVRQIWTGELRKPITRIAWSPDGTEILVVSGWLWGVASDGSSSRVLGSSTSSAEISDAVWSPDAANIIARVTRGERTRSDFKLLHMDKDGANLKVIVELDTGVGGGLHVWPSNEADEPPSLMECSAGTVVHDPKANEGLVKDCEVLVGIRETLAGGDLLNWDSNISIMEWQNVKIGGSPPRVQSLHLVRAGLIGPLPASLGGLSEVRVINLSSNALIGSIPSELSNLSSLESLRLDSNYLSGPVPDVLSNISSLRLLDVERTFISDCVPKELLRLMAAESKRIGCITAEVDTQ